jgi:hypothetical protein
LNKELDAVIFGLSELEMNYYRVPSERILYGEQTAEKYVEYKLS